jgi:pimeloyl-ACP methyl ester carboxylesterase
MAAAIAAAPLALAWRFALVYRVRAGFPRPKPPAWDPSDLGLAFETLSVAAADATLAAWFIPARGGNRGPGVALVHGWDSARDRTLPLALVLHAAGFHVLTVDVRGHGANPAEDLPVSAGEFGLDALAAFEALVARPEVTAGAIAGHSMGGVGAILAAAADGRVAALVAISAPADPWRLTRQTFRLARLPLPDAVAYPLAWFTTRVFLRPRGHTVDAISATKGVARYAGPILLLHGDEDAVVPVAHVARLERAARDARKAAPRARPVESVVIAGGGHSWLYEWPVYRRAIARFLAGALGGPLDPETAGDVAAGVPATRLADRERPVAVDEAELLEMPVALPDAEPPTPLEPFNPLGLAAPVEP